MGRKVDQFDDFKSMPPILVLVHTVWYKKKKSKRIDHSYTLLHKASHFSFDFQNIVWYITIRATVWEDITNFCSYSLICKLYIIVTLSFGSTSKNMWKMGEVESKFVQLLLMLANSVLKVLIW